jgi:stage II sporulation protein R
MKKVALLVFALFVLIMSWEDQKSVAALFAQGPIPQESIRLRIIANSDTPEDQALKRDVRDHINAYLSTKVGSLKSIDQAREEIHSQLPELTQIVNGTIADKGYNYKSNVELGIVPFPTKMYGQYIYPAGNYEALRVTIGSGLGQNWWCVLFPPLCFVDISNGDAVKKDQLKATPAGKVATKTAKGSGAKSDSASENNPPVQYRFFIVELLQKLFSAIFGGH